MKKLHIKQFKNGPSNLLLVGLILIASFFALSKLVDRYKNTVNLDYSTLLTEIQKGDITKITVGDNVITGHLKDKRAFTTTIGKNTNIDRALKGYKVDIAYEEPSTDFGFTQILLLLFLIIPLAMVYFLYRQTRGAGSGGGSNVFGMSKSKAKMFMPSQIKTTFKSVAGCHEAKEELEDVVDFLKNPEKYQRIGAKLTRGVLLVGEPGNGKTLLARAVAGETNRPFFSASGSDFIELFAGIGAARVRDLFDQARRHSPSIIFIDEIDAIGRQRGNGFGGVNEEREQTLNQLLTEMDGFESAQTPVVVLAATNRPDVLDKALLRPGRLDRQVTVPYPDLKSREEILQVHIKDVKVDPAIDVQKIARGTPGFTGADLANLINEAAIHASKHNKSIITLEDFEEARDKVMLGKERKSIIMTDKEKEVTAYHEAGHALMILLNPEHTDPLYKITIVPRGRALGVTHSLPERDKHSQSKEEFEAQVRTMLGGRAAEEIVFNKLETGAYSDFIKATEVVRNMVCHYGMSPKLGPVVYDSQRFEYSQHTAELIDEEVRSMMLDYYKQSVDMIRAHRDKLEKLATALLEKETLFPEEIYQLLDIQPRVEHSF